MAGESVNVPLPAEFLESFGLTGAALRRAKEDSRELLKNIREAEKSGKALSPEIIDRRTKLEETTERLKARSLVEAAETASKKSAREVFTQIGTFYRGATSASSWGELASALPYGGVGAFAAKGGLTRYLTNIATRYATASGIQEAIKIDAVIKAGEISLAEAAAGRSSMSAMSPAARVEYEAAVKASGAARSAAVSAARWGAAAKITGSVVTAVGSWPVAIASVASSFITTTLNYAMETEMKNQASITKNLGILYERMLSDQYGTKYEPAYALRSMASMDRAAKQASVTNWFNPLEVLSSAGNAIAAVPIVGTALWGLGLVGDRYKTERMAKARDQDNQYREWERTQGTRLADNLSLWKLQGDFHTPGSVLARKWAAAHRLNYWFFTVPSPRALIPATDFEINEMSTQYQEELMKKITAARTARQEFVDINPRYRAEEALRSMRITALEHDKYRTTLQWNRY